MRLLTVKSGGRLRSAVMVGDEVLSFGAAGDVIDEARAVPDAMVEVLAGGAVMLERVAAVARRASEPAKAERLRAAGSLTAFADAVLGPVVPTPTLVLSGSMNSRGHVAEMGDVAPEHPCAFQKVRSALSGSGAEITPPARHGDMLDWEGELCVVIGRRCHDVGVDEALEYAAGYTLLNDISAREFVRPFVTASGAASTAQAWERNVLGKNFPGFAPIGPVIVTQDELPRPFNYHMETLVNGRVMQSSTQEDLVFGPAQMIAYFSQFYIFEPGDIISMGSPPGVGMARRPPIFLKPGDTVEVRVKEIGSLVNRIAQPEAD